MPWGPRYDARALMPRLLSVGLACALLVLPFAVAAPSAHADASGSDGGTVEPDSEPVRLLVTSTSTGGGPAVAAAAQSAAVVADSAAGSDATTAAPPQAGRSQAGDSAAASSAVTVLEFDTAAEAAQAAPKLAARPDVVAVEPDAELHPDLTAHDVLDLDGQAEVGPLTGAEPVGSSALTSWGVANDGSTIAGRPGARGVDVGAGAARSHASGVEVVIAVIDTGVDIDHPLLRGRIWTNPAERRDGRDTDGNGYVDDVHGWNFVHNTPEVFRDAAADYHGTHVAGVAAGIAWPQIGFSGVAPAAKIMPLKFIDGEVGRTSDAIAAIRYAIDNGADVINASWGGPDASTALRQVLAESPIPVVAAAGNHGTSVRHEPSYPAAYDLDTVISVASIDHDGQLSSFTSYGRDGVDVTAPGGLIPGPYPGERMLVGSGSSAAVPHVSGVLALALEHHRDHDPAALSQAVRATVRPLAGADRTISGGLVRAPVLLDQFGTRMPVCAPAGRLAFEDVSKTSPHRDAVGCLVDRGITKGVSADTFGSSRDLTRAQIATLVARAFDAAGVLPPPPEAGRFADVPDGGTHRDAIETLAELGVVTGVTATSYEPSRATTRAELAAVVARAAEYLAGAPVRATGPGFSDTAGVMELAQIEKAAGLRVILGREDGKFQPQLAVRRDQAASMVSRLLDRLTQQGVLEAI